MKKDQIFVDEHGVKWITPAKVAELWNEIALQRGIEANYTRWSVYQRRDALPYLDTPLGRLFREDAAREISLYPRSVTREDVGKRNRQRRKKTPNGEGDSNSPSVMLMGFTAPHQLMGAA